MPLTNAIHESLPYIDTEPSASERAAALALILAEASSEDTKDTTTTHPSLPDLAPQSFTPLLLSELTRIESQTPLTGITTTHYESQDAPSTTPDSDEKSPSTLLAWKSALQNAYTSQAYLEGRVANLGLLERYGKNAWLEGNRQLEDVLRGLERELEVRKGEIDGVVIERKRAQE
ncbi:Pre-mRNA-splicing factor SPF27, partial [Leptodontidium sp. 2 PMI_412]